MRVLVRIEASIVGDMEIEDDGGFADEEELNTLVRVEIGRRLGLTGVCDIDVEAEPRGDKS